jgi:hypothetical protein
LAARRGLDLIDAVDRFAREAMGKIGNASRRLDNRRLGASIMEIKRRAWCDATKIAQGGVTTLDFFSITGIDGGFRFR